MAFLIAMFVAAKANALDVKVAEPIELMSVLARTAGYDEYCKNGAREYTKDVDEHFGKYSDHSAVRYMKEIRENYGVAYDAVMAIAINLCIENGHVCWRYDGKGLTERRASQMDKVAFIAKVDSFYQQTGFHKFFLNHVSLYNKVCDAFRKNVLSQFDSTWYARFYAKEAQEDFNIVIGCVNSAGNYGPHIDLKGHRKQNYAIIGLTIGDDGQPKFGETLSTLVHEFCHSFCPRDIVRGDTALQKKFDKAMQYIWFTTNIAMRNNSYGNKLTIVNESLVRASTICYLIEHGNKGIFGEVVNQINRGFRWLPGLIKLLRKYEKNRDKYKSIDDLCPEIVNYLYDFTCQESQEIREAIAK